MQTKVQKIIATALAAIYGLWTAPLSQAYAFNELVPDVRQPSAVSGGSACPVKSHQLTAAGSIAERWSTALGTTPVTIITLDQTAAGRLNEIEQVITKALGVWTGVSGTTLLPGSLAPLARVSAATSCGSDGVNSICFDQLDMAFTPGVLAFTRVITADKIGAKLGSGSVATQLGQILDADNRIDRGTHRASQCAFVAIRAAWRDRNFRLPRCRRGCHERSGNRSGDSGLELRLAGTGAV